MSEPTPFDATFCALGQRLNCASIIGERDDAGATGERRIVWTRSGALRPEACPYQVDAQNVVGRLAHPWQTTAYGATDLEVSQMVADLWWNLDQLVGPPQGDWEVPGHEGYQLTPGKVAPVGGDLHAAAYACPVQVTLYTLAGPAVVTAPIVSAPVQVNAATDTTHAEQAIPVLAGAP
jgi:hypothetical protein